MLEIFTCDLPYDICKLIAEFSTHSYSNELLYKLFKVTNPAYPKNFRTVDILHVNVLFDGKLNYTTSHLRGPSPDKYTIMLYNYVTWPTEHEFLFTIPYPSSPANKIFYCVKKNEIIFDGVIKFPIKIDDSEHVTEITIL